jgi:hypothetical protein
MRTPQFTFVLSGKCFLLPSNLQYSGSMYEPLNNDRIILLGAVLPQALRLAAHDHSLSADPIIGSSKPCAR